MTIAAVEVMQDDITMTSLDAIIVMPAASKSRKRKLSYTTMQLQRVIYAIFSVLMNALSFIPTYNTDI